MTELLASWLPLSSMALLCFGLAIKTAHQSQRIRLLESENSELRVKQMELEKANVELQKQRPKRRVWPDDYEKSHESSEHERAGYADKPRP